MSDLWRTASCWPDMLLASLSKVSVTWSLGLLPPPPSASSWGGSPPLAATAAASALEGLGGVCENLPEEPSRGRVRFLFRKGMVPIYVMIAAIAARNKN